MKRKRLPYVYSPERIIKCKDTGEVVTGDKYLMTDHWRNLRERLYIEHGKKCQKCKKKISLSQVDCHHKNYDRVGYERDSDLMILCRDCHTVITAENQKKAEQNKKNKELKDLIFKLNDKEREKVRKYIWQIIGK